MVQAGFSCAVIQLHPAESQRKVGMLGHFAVLDGAFEPERFHGPLHLRAVELHGAQSSCEQTNDLGKVDRCIEPVKAEVSHRARDRHRLPRLNALEPFFRRPPGHLVHLNRSNVIDGGGAAENEAEKVGHGPSRCQVSERRPAHG